MHFILEAERLANLRAEVWRLAAQPALTEHALIQSLLDLVGAALNGVRICFYHREGDVFVCSSEWKIPSARSSMGRVIPASFGSLLIGQGSTLELSLSGLRSRLVDAGMDVPDSIQSDIEPVSQSAPVLFIPFMLAGNLHGVLTLTRQPSEESPTVWHASIKQVLDEVVHIITLVVERRRAEDALRASETRYRSLVENLGDGVGIMDPNEIFLFANPAGHEVFGVPDGTLPGRSLHEFTDERSFQKAREQTGVRKQGRKSTYELEIRRADGATRLIMVTAVPEVDAQGNLVATIGNFRDVTQQRQIERERQLMETRVHQAQKLESLGLLAGGIAHDFNNLLLGVMANADMALDEAAPGTPLREYLDDILHASRKASELTNQMLAYSGRGRVQIQSLDLSQVVQDMALLLRASISKKAIMTFDLVAALPPIEGDVTQIRQVVMNLITNASDALGDLPGRISMSTGIIQVDQNLVADPLVTGSPKPGAYVYFEVADSGCGMDEATRARIFDPFFTTRFTGRGLGLAAVLGIVRSHDGAIRVESQPGSGTVFRVMFPSSSTPKAASESSAVPPADPWKGVGTVLVVDDEDVVRRATTRILERAGLKVIAARDGAEGLERFRQHAEEVSAVVLDLAMPGMGGEEVFRELHAGHPDLPVVLISGYDEQEAAVRFTSKGIAGFVRKPFDAEGLLGPLRKALARARRRAK
ncbi:MAG: response regulator [Deltaproteobacteria bacterium]|nr:response regulator [Deltaproteobacteria bacterium]